MNAICVYCGSSVGRRPEYVDSARALGAMLAREDIRLVYGGSSVGVMGVLADAALEAGGEVVGVIPERLVARELAHPALSELHVVGSMHERKARMADLSDGFVALPGGLGTLEELFEMLTWAQLGLHGKPCAVLNVLGYFEGLLDFLDHQAAEGFLKPAHRAMVKVAADANELIAAFRAHRPARVPK